MTIAGQLHIFVAFDWGDEIDLDKARHLVRATVQGLPRRRRTPSSFSYRALPLACPVAPVPLEIPELGKIQCRRA